MSLSSGAHEGMQRRQSVYDNVSVSLTAIGQ